MNIELRLNVVHMQFSFVSSFIRINYFVQNQQLVKIYSNKIVQNINSVYNDLLLKIIRKTVVRMCSDGPNSPIHIYLPKIPGYLPVI